MTKDIHWPSSFAHLSVRSVPPMRQGKPPTEDPRRTGDQVMTTVDEVVDERVAPNSSTSEGWTPARDTSVQP